MIITIHSFWTHKRNVGSEQWRKFHIKKFLLLVQILVSWVVETKVSEQTCCLHPHVKSQWGQDADLSPLPCPLPGTSFLPTCPHNLTTSSALSSTLKIEAVCSFGTSVPPYKTTRCQPRRQQSINSLPWKPEILNSLLRFFLGYVRLKFGVGISFGCGKQNRWVFI